MNHKIQIVKKYLLVVLFVPISFMLFYALSEPADAHKIEKKSIQLIDNISSGKKLKKANLAYEKSLSIQNMKKAVVSWYGGAFHHNGPTASGKVFNENALTAAHKSLPFGTKVKFFNPKNGKQVVVEITDRGPYIKGREFDLSKEAFSQLASLNRGLVNIFYEIME